MRYEEYIPEIDYAGRNYEPIKGRKNHFCHDCVDYYQDLHDKGLTKRRFPFRYENDAGRKVVRCRFDQSLIKEEIVPEAFDTPDEYQTAMRIADPVTWAWTEIAWEPRWYQREILNCTSQFKAVRAGRRVGKTEALTILLMWYAFTRKNFEILVVCPYVAQVDKIFSKVREMMRRSPALANSVVRDVRSSPQIIELNNGSKIRGFASGSAKGSDQIRGQDADLIVIDEVDYIPDADIEVIMAILTSNKHTRVVVSSTPTGLRSRLFEWSTNKDDRWKEFWYISAEGPSWDEEVEELYRSMYSPGGYAREFLAEFGEELEGVFRGKDIQKCIFDYSYESCRPDHKNFTYTMGVDWNKHTGTHIVVVERPKEAPRIFYRVVAKEIVRKSEFTQLAGVQKILEMDLKWKPAYVYCDAGYGHTQIEMIWKEGERNPHRLYRKRFKPIEMGGKTIIFDPIDSEEIKKDTKPLMVYLAAHQVEKHLVMFPKSEDTAIRVIPEELAFQEIGLVQQARGFKVTKRSPAGRETFSQDYEHTLTAWMLAMFAHLMEFGDYQKVAHDHFIGTTGPLGMGKKTRSFAMYDEFGHPLPPAMVKQRMEALRKQWEAEQSERKEQMRELAGRRRESFGSDSSDVEELQYDDAGNHRILIAKVGGSGAKSRGSGHFGRRAVLNSIRRTSRNRRLRGRGF